MEIEISEKRELKKLLRQAAFVAALAIVAIIAGTVLLLSRLHERALRNAQTDILRQSLTLSKSTERDFRSVEVVLESIGDKSNGLMSNKGALTKLIDRDARRILNAKIAGLPQVNEIGIVDAEGMRIIRSGKSPSRSRSFSHTRFFQTLKNNRDMSRFVGVWARNGKKNDMPLVIARPVLAANGTFAGAVYGLIDLKYFEGLFQETSFGEGYAAALLQTDGTLLARYPESKKVGTRISIPIVREAAASGYKVSRVRSPIDQTMRIAASYRVKGLPLYVVVTQAERSAFAIWRRTAALTFGVALLIAIVVTIVAGFIVRSRAQRGRLNVARAKATESANNWERTKAELARQKDLALQSVRFDAAVENMSQGLCMFDAQQRLIVCNTQYAKLYKLTSQQTVPGTALESILAARGVNGTAAVNQGDGLGNRSVDPENLGSYQVVRKLCDGREILIVRRPMEGGGWVATHEDITVQKSAEKELHDTKVFLESIIANVPVAIVVKDAKSRKFVLTNSSFEAMTGASRSELIGRTAFDIYQRNDAELFEQLDIEAIESSNSVLWKETASETPRFGPRHFRSSRIVIRDEQGNPEYLIVVIDDITEQKRSEQKISFMAHHDALTGLCNRLAMMQEIKTAAERLRDNGDAFTLLLLDLDGFKSVNDALGHPCGDELLREVATRLKALLRKADVLARLGGDEFAIIQMGGINQRETALTLAERIIDTFVDPFQIESNEVTIGTSIGIAMAPAHGSDSKSLVKRADLALYRAKSGGRNNYRFFDLEMDDAISARHETEQELRRAIQKGELELHYQPIVDTKTFKVCAAEALIRWRHPTRGLIYPSHFIGVAEETGLITQIGEWVLLAACAEAAKWPENVKVAVNLSSVQFRKSNLPEVLMYALARSGLPPERLELEITETALIESEASCVPMLRQFKNLGVAVALDDFGTGYSSLSQLTMFSFDKIKIDKSFTQGMPNRPECSAIILAALALAQNLNMETTAEGVESVDQCRLLRLAGVTSLQGYLFSAPCLAAEIDFGRVYNVPELGAAA
jgi:diguanylate cyclase (GGDEF)-like protein/PAS domain S-box-containing protein